MTLVRSSQNKRMEQACHTITQSIQNGTVLEPFILYLYITLSMGCVIAYSLLYGTS